MPEKESELKALTPRQEEVLSFLCYVEDKWGRPATTAEVLDHFHFASPFAYTKHCMVLYKKGYMSKDVACHKSYRVARYPDGSKFKTRQELLDEISMLRLALSLHVPPNR